MSDVILNVIIILGIIIAGGFLIFFVGDLLLSIIDPACDEKKIISKNKKTLDDITKKLEEVSPEIAEVVKNDPKVIAALSSLNEGIKQEDVKKQEYQVKEEIEVKKQGKKDDKPNILVEEYESIDEPTNNDVFIEEDNDDIDDQEDEENERLSDMRKALEKRKQDILKRLRQNEYQQDELDDDSEENADDDSEENETQNIENFSNNIESEEMFDDFEDEEDIQLNIKDKDNFDKEQGKVIVEETEDDAIRKFIELNLEDKKKEQENIDVNLKNQQNDNNLTINQDNTEDDDSNKEQINDEDIRKSEEISKLEAEKELKEEKEKYTRLIKHLLNKEKELKEAIDNTKLSKPKGNKEEYQKRLEIKLDQLAENEKELRDCNREYKPLIKVKNALEKDEKKLRIKEAQVAKEKVLLYGVNNYGELDTEKAKKLTEDLDLLEGLKLSVQHCKDVMNENKDRLPILEKLHNSLKKRNEHLKADIEYLKNIIDQL